MSVRTVSRRLTNTVIRLVGRSPNDYAEELQRFLEKLSKQVFGGIPAGFNEVVPEDISADDTGSAGSESSGWAAADHQHAILTDTAVDLEDSNSEGTSASLSRADHTHKRSVRVQLELVDVSTRNAISFTSEDFNVSDDPGNDAALVELPLRPTDIEYLAWVL